MNLAKPERPPMFVLCVLSIFPFQCPGRLHNAETLDVPSAFLIDQRKLYQQALPRL